MIWEAAWIALRAIWGNKLRTLLTVLGNIIAVAALVLVVAFVQGVNAEVKRLILRRGADTLFVERFGPIASEEEWERVRRRPELTLEDADAIRRGATLVAQVLTQWNFRSPVRSARHSVDAVEIEARSAEYPDFLDETLDVGRHFTDTEERHAVPVAILGSELAEALFPDASALGRAVRVEGRHFEVIGVMKSRGALLGQSQDRYLVLPLRTALQACGPAWGGVDIAVKPRRPELLDACADEVRTLLREHRRLRPLAEDPFDLLSTATFLRMYARSTAAIYAALVGLVALALVVGSIVIANVMLMVVTQRTREIGIRKAVGARRTQILAQFLVESATLSLCGGLAGFVLGAAVTTLAGALTPLSFRIEPWSVAVGLGMVLAVGVLAGLYPASRAASLDPILALRAER